MREKLYSLLGIAGPLTAYALIAASIALSPWFSWERNALSDLGHATRSQAAPIFNFGLFLAGFLLIVYSIKSFAKHAKYAGACLIVASLLLQLIAAFNETYGSLHFVVSVLFFVALLVGSLVYAYECRSLLGVASFVIGFASWAAYFAFGVYRVGIAVPETASSAAAMLWVAHSALKTYFRQ